MTTETRPEPITVGRLTIDPYLHWVTLDGEPVHFSRIEYNLLLTLAEEPERVFTREELLTAVWGPDWIFHLSGDTRNADQVAFRLRKKLGKDFIHNEWGVGYRLVVPGSVNDA